MIKVLATAKPNVSYDNIQNIKDCILEARLVNGQIEVWETHTNEELKDWKVKLTSECVASLFSTEVVAHERPFLIHENRDFYTCFMHKEPRYHERYHILRTKKLQ